MGKTNKTPVILLILASCLLMFLLGYNAGRVNRQSLGLPEGEDIIVMTDTVTVRDTVTQFVETRRSVVRHDTIITPKDTVYLPIEQKAYVTAIENDTVRGNKYPGGG